VHKLSHSVLSYVRRHELLHPGDRVGVAVSGGADSIALLRLMVELRQELGIVLSVVHFNHKLRGAESDADEQFVSKLAAMHQLELIFDAGDVRQYAADKKMSLETAARTTRYEFFERCLRDSSLDKIATAHTLDDQAETVLMKLARGAGTRGLSGIYPRITQLPASNGHAKAIVRPLLAINRSDLEKYLSEIGQCWREDSSNRDLRHTRNRVRHGILPRLERHLNPSVREVLAETAEIARAEEDYWGHEIARLLPQAWMQSQEGGSLHASQFDSLPLAVRRRLVRAAGELLGLNLDFRHVEEVLALHGEGESVSLPGGWIVRRHKLELQFEPECDEAADYQYELPVPGKVVVGEVGLMIEARMVQEAQGSQMYDPEQLLDVALLGSKLIVRNWRAGERFWPLHTKEPRKIKEFLQDRHVTGGEKKQWPVIANGNEIVWLRGFGVRRDFQSKAKGGGVLIRDVPIDENPE
jgi:tRNA(Ile)-lysidine synthase